MKYLSHVKDLYGRILPDRFRNDKLELADLSALHANAINIHIYQEILFLVTASVLFLVTVSVLILEYE